MYNICVFVLRKKTQKFSYDFTTYRVFRFCYVATIINNRSIISFHRMVINIISSQNLFFSPNLPPEQHLWCGLKQFWKTLITQPLTSLTLLYIKIETFYDRNKCSKWALTVFSVAVPISFFKTSSRNIKIVNRTELRIPRTMMPSSENYSCLFMFSKSILFCFQKLFMFVLCFHKLFWKQYDQT